MDTESSLVEVPRHQTFPGYNASKLQILLDQGSLLPCDLSSPSSSVGVIYMLCSFDGFIHELVFLECIVTTHCILKRFISSSSSLFQVSSFQNGWGSHLKMKYLGTERNCSREYIAYCILIPMKHGYMYLKKQSNDKERKKEKKEEREREGKKRKKFYITVHFSIHQSFFTYEIRSFHQMFWQPHPVNIILEIYSLFHHYQYITQGSPVIADIINQSQYFSCASYNLFLNYVTT